MVYSILQQISLRQVSPHTRRRCEITGKSLGNHWEITGKSLGNHRNGITGMMKQAKNHTKKQDSSNLHRDNVAIVPSGFSFQCMSHAHSKAATPSSA